MDGRKFIDVDLERKLDENHHLGHIILETFRKKRPEYIAQIDGATDAKETYHSMLDRIIRLARSLTNFGLKPGDVIALAGTNHLDLRVPFYAGMINGLPIAGVDPSFKYAEIKGLLSMKPKLAFCNYENEENYKKAAKDLGINMTVITFLGGEMSMQKFIEKYDDNMPTDDFRPPTFNPNEIYAWLMSTSGTTGVPKLVSIKQKSVPIALLSSADVTLSGTTSNNRKQNVSLILSPIQWASAFLFGTVATFSGVAILSTTKLGDIEHIIDVINKYKPNTAPGSPALWVQITQSNKPCDLTCFESIAIGGAKVYKDLVVTLKKRLKPNAIIKEVYGQTEVLGVITSATPGSSPLGSCGKVVAGCSVKLVHPNGDEITEPNVPGELLYKGLMFDGFYNNPEETAKAFTEDGWLRTGDQLYRDDDGNYFFVERLKMIIKFRNTHVIPTELEEVIRLLPGVQEVCVTSIDHPIDQQWPVAVVVKQPDCQVTAQEIKDIVAEKLSDAKKLRGGIVFVDKLPLTSTGKVARNEVRNIAATAVRE